jgi:ubiquinone/menaquinone biosynthesis C-methylase UbiE
MEFDKYRKFGAYHWWQYDNDAKYHRHADKVKEWVQEKNVLDIGAGDGKITSFLNAKGIDNEPIAVKLAQEKGVDVILGSAYDIPYKDEEFDAVFMGDVLEHLEFPRQALQETRRVLKKYLYLVTPQKGTNKERFHYEEWTPDELKILVESEGFKLEGEIFDGGIKFKRIYGKFLKC